MFSSRISALLLNNDEKEKIDKALYPIYLSIIDLLQLYEETIDSKYLTDAATLLGKLNVIEQPKSDSYVETIYLKNYLVTTDSRISTADIPDNYQTTVGVMLHARQQSICASDVKHIIKPLEIILALIKELQSTFDLIPAWEFNDRYHHSDLVTRAKSMWIELVNQPTSDPLNGHRDYARNLNIDGTNFNKGKIDDKLFEMIEQSIKHTHHKTDRDRQQLIKQIKKVLDGIGQDMTRITDILLDQYGMRLMKSVSIHEGWQSSENGCQYYMDVIIYGAIYHATEKALYYDHDEGKFVITDSMLYVEKYHNKTSRPLMRVRMTCSFDPNEHAQIKIDNLIITSYTKFFKDPKSSNILSKIEKSISSIFPIKETFDDATTKLQHLSLNNLANPELAKFRLKLFKLKEKLSDSNINQIKQEEISLRAKLEKKLLPSSPVTNTIISFLEAYENYEKYIIAIKKSEKNSPLLSEFLWDNIPNKLFTMKSLYEIEYIYRILQINRFYATAEVLQTIHLNMAECVYKTFLMPAARIILSEIITCKIKECALLTKSESDFFKLEVDETLIELKGGTHSLFKPTLMFLLDRIAAPIGDFDVNGEFFNQKSAANHLFKNLENKNKMLSTQVINEVIETAIAFLREESSQGNIYCLYVLGRILHSGWGEISYPQQASLMMIKQAANQGVPEASTYLGCLFFEKNDLREAYYWFKKAREEYSERKEDHQLEDILIIKTYQKITGDEDNALFIEVCKSALSSKNKLAVAMAATELALYLYNKNHTSGRLLELFEQFDTVCGIYNAALEDFSVSSASAAYELALTIFNRIKHLADYDDIFKYFKQGAELDNPIAQAYLSRMYQIGHGTAVNLREAAYWRVLALEHQWKGEDESPLKDDFPDNTILKQAVEERKRQIDFFRSRTTGCFLHDKQQFLEATQAFRLALEINPNDLLSNEGLSLSTYQVHYQDALNAFRRKDYRHAIKAICYALEFDAEDSKCIAMKRKIETKLDEKDHIINMIIDETITKIRNSFSTDQYTKITSVVELKNRLREYLWESHDLDIQKFSTFSLMILSSLFSDNLKSIFILGIFSKEIQIDFTLYQREMLEEAMMEFKSLYSYSIRNFRIDKSAIATSSIYAFFKPHEDKHDTGDEVEMLPVLKFGGHF